MQFSSSSDDDIPYFFQRRNLSGAFAGPSQPSSSDDEFSEDTPIRHYEPQDFEDESFDSDEEVIHPMNFFHSNFNIPPVNIPLSISSPLDYSFPADIPNILNIPPSQVRSQIINSSYYRKEDENIRSFFVSSHIPKIVLKYLKRLQIFTRQREEMNEWSLIWALKQKGIPDDIIFNIKSDPNHKVLTILSGLCEDNLITLRIYRYLGDEAFKYKQRTKVVPVRHNGKRNNYLGIDPKRSQTIIDLYYYDGHYFLKEVTPFSLRYLENFDERYLNDKKKVNSLELILSLEEKGLI